VLFEKRRPKQNTVSRLKSNILPPKIFGLVTPVMRWEFLSLESRHVDFERKGDDEKPAEHHLVYENDG